MQHSIGKTIKDLRKSRGLTQEELAERIGVTAQAISKWENESGMPDLSQIVPLAHIFGVSTDTLLGTGDTNKNEDVFSKRETSSFFAGDHGADGVGAPLLAGAIV